MKALWSGKEGGENMFAAWFQKRRGSRIKTDLGAGNREYVIRSSICTGEKVAGYINENRKFIDIMLLQNAADKEAFCKQYGIDTDSLREIY